MTVKTTAQIRAEWAEQDRQIVASRDRTMGKINTTSRLSEARKNMILTTDPNHQLPVCEHIDIVTTEVVVGMNIFKDILTGVRNIVGGRTGNVQTALRDIRQQALRELRSEAARLGADAVVGVDLNYNEIGATGSTMLMLVASGTAVKLDMVDE